MAVLGQTQDTESKFRVLRATMTAGPDFIGNLGNLLEGLLESGKFAAGIIFHSIMFALQEEVTRSCLLELLS